MLRALGCQAICVSHTNDSFIHLKLSRPSLGTVNSTSARSLRPLSGFCSFSNLLCSRGLKLCFLYGLRVGKDGAVTTKSLFKKEKQRSVLGIRRILLYIISSTFDKFKVFSFPPFLDFPLCVCMHTDVGEARRLEIPKELVPCGCELPEVGKGPQGLLTPELSLEESSPLFTFRVQNLCGQV